MLVGRREGQSYVWTVFYHIEGQITPVAVHLLESVLCLPPAIRVSGKVTFGIAPPFGPYRAKDGDVLTIFGGGPLWPEFCGIIGLEHLAHDPKFESDEDRA